MVAHVKHERLATKALRDRGGEPFGPELGSIRQVDPREPTSAYARR